MSPAAPAVGHVFVVNIENESAEDTFGPDSGAPYLARELRSQGVLLTDYYGIAHNSLPNYIAQISGQGPNEATQGDCLDYVPFVQTGEADPGQAVGAGCVYPAGVPTLSSQLDAAHLTWRGYMEDMTTPCEHPEIGGVDETKDARPESQYATRHDPFMYFEGVIADPAYCAQHVVDLAQLDHDLASVSTTPQLSYITPDLCADGHDDSCADGGPGGQEGIEQWMRMWVPRILGSAAYQQDGVLVITADEAPESDATACCGEGAGPNTDAPGLTGPGGGEVGALVLSRFATAGATDSTPYNHYSLLAWLEDVFGVARLGYARDATPFGPDVLPGLAR